MSNYNYPNSTFNYRQPNRSFHAPPNFQQPGYHQNRWNPHHNQHHWNSWSAQPWDQHNPYNQSYSFSMQNGYHLDNVNHNSYTNIQGFMAPQKSDSQWTWERELNDPETTAKTSNEVSEKLHPYKSGPSTVKNAKRILKSFSKPVESDKATRMMQLMGWKGGALGTTGDGITEPLVPNLFQARNAGFGSTESNKPNSLKSTNVSSMQAKRKANKEISNKKQAQKTKHIIQHLNASRKQFKAKKARPVSQNLKIEILNRILDFVRDDSLTELALDKNLTKFQRKIVHNLVESIRENVDYGNFDSLLEVDLIQEILGHGCSTELFTESSGKFPDRQLYLYKGVPDHVYQIVQEDLNGDDYVENDDECNVIVVDDDDDDKETVMKPDDNITDNKATESNACSNIEVLSVKADKHGEDEKNSQDNKNISAESNDKIVEPNINKNVTEEVNENVETVTLNNDIDNIIVKEGSENDSKENNDKESVKVKLDGEKLRELLIEFLKEFFNDEKYTEMRFSGQFNELEIEVINDFILDVERCIIDVSECKELWKPEDNYLEEIFLNEKNYLAIKKCSETNTLILKLPKDCNTNYQEISD